MGAPRNLDLFDQQVLEPGGIEDLDLVAPSEQVPGKLAHTAGPEAHDHGAVHLRLKLLVGMEAPAQGALRGGRQDAQHHVLGIVLVDAEAFVGVVLKGAALWPARGAAVATAARRAAVSTFSAIALAPPAHVPTACWACGSPAAPRAASAPAVPAWKSLSNLAGMRKRRLRGSAFSSPCSNMSRAPSR